MPHRPFIYGPPPPRNGPSPAPVKSDDDHRRADLDAFVEGPGEFVTVPEAA